MAGKPRPGLRSGTAFTGDPEQKRGVKEWLSAHFAPGHRYRPTTDQLAMTQMIDFAVLRASGMASFGTLERALAFLSNPSPNGKMVYP